MRSYQLLLRAGALVAVAACAGCAGFQTAPPSGASRHGPIAVHDSSRLRGGCRDPDIGAITNPDNAAIRPYDPWLGAVSVCPISGPGYRIGTALCVPRLDAPGGSSARSSSPAREVAVGVWLQLDF